MNEHIQVQILEFLSKISPGQTLHISFNIINRYVDFESK